MSTFSSCDIIKKIDTVLDSAFFCPLNTKLSSIVNKAEEALQDFSLDPELMKEYTEAAISLLAHRKKKKGPDKTMKALKNKMQFLHTLIYAKFKKEHPEDVEAYKKYQSYLYEAFKHHDDFIFEPEWIKAAHESFGTSSLLSELERVISEAETYLPEIGESNISEVEKIAHDLGERLIMQRPLKSWKDDRTLRKYIKKTILPVQPSAYRPLLYITLYKEFCVLVIESWVWHW